MVLAGWKMSQIGKYLEREPAAIERAVERIKEDPIMNKTRERYGEPEA
tara:strand:+ start:1208 stop:1351 length:144 start_codon:yes stop_codon:yes gene_type:complete